jgi:hypothetical protein
VFRSQPDLKIGKRTVPIKYLNDKGKEKAKEMKDLHRFVLDSPEGSEKKKDDPKKMDQNHAIRKNLVDHLLNQPQICNP